MTTFRVGDKVTHLVDKNSVGTVMNIADKTTTVIWNKGCNLANLLPERVGYHLTSNLVLETPATLQYNPNQQGDTDDDL